MAEPVHEVPGPRGDAPDWDGLADAALQARTPSEFVGDLADRRTRFPAYFALDKLGAEALPAIRDGLRDEAWEVRRWSAALLDHHADDGTIHDLIPLLDDPMSKVAMLAEHCTLDDRVADAFEHVVAEEKDRKVRFHAAAGLKRYRRERG